MTTIVISRRKPSPLREDWKAWAAPWKFVTTVVGKLSRACRVISATAGPRATPGLRLKEIVTAGIWPWWLTVSGPTVGTRRATESRGTSCPDADRT
jgi:hypothetical protein